MKSFIQRFSDKIIGVLNGFDRLVLRGTLRPIAYSRGMMGFLWHKQVLLKDFGHYVEGVTKQLKEASCQAALTQKRPIIYLRSCNTDKQSLVQKVATKDGITNGLVAVITCVEPCMSYEISRNSKTKKLDLLLRPRRCMFLYHYLIDPQFGFMNARIQTWFPFNIQICLNGREWLARQMDLVRLRKRMGHGHCIQRSLRPRFHLPRSRFACHDHIFQSRCHAVFGPQASRQLSRRGCY